MWEPHHSTLKPKLAVRVSSVSQLSTNTLAEPSSDLQRVAITLRVLYRPEKKLLPSIYQRLGLDYSKNVFDSVGNEVLKAIVVGDCSNDWLKWSSWQVLTHLPHKANYDATELISRREIVSIFDSCCYDCFCSARFLRVGNTTIRFRVRSANGWLLVQEHLVWSLTMWQLYVRMRNYECTYLSFCAVDAFDIQ